MQKLVSKYALAAHLAIMAVAPLFLLPLAGVHATATVMLWLAAFGFVWVLMEPSRRRYEMPHNARERVDRAVVRDPLFWCMVVLVVYAGIRMFNSGIALAYDAELMSWSIKPPVFELMPGCVGESGYFPFAVVVTLTIILQALRHALGRSARAAFLLVASLLSALAAFVLAFAVSYHNKNVVALTHFSLTSPSCFGTVFGIQLLGGLAAFFATVENRWFRAEPLAGLGLVGNAIGLVLFAPVPTIAAFLIAFLLLAIILFILAHGRLEGSGSFRCALAILIALVAPVLYALATEGTPAMGEKIAAVKSVKIFPDELAARREALSSIALKTWKANPWIGTGLDSFPLDIRFSATEEDWAVVPPTQQAVPNGWWQLLAERGVIGALMIAVALGMLLWTFFARLIFSFRSVHFEPIHFVGPLALLALVALAFVDCSYLRPEVLLLTGAIVACSGVALPENRTMHGEGKEI